MPFQGVNLNVFSTSHPVLFLSLSDQFYTKMSSTLASPFAAALPSSHIFFQYDEDGDVIMTDAHTGLPITYGGAKRGRSDSSDEALSPIKIPRTPVGSPTMVCPGAPKKGVPSLPPSPPSSAAEDDESPARNLALQMAEAVLEGEPRDPPAAAVPPPGGAPADADWCLSVNCPDLALRLDMRHPRVVLDFLRFVDSYNELAPYGEEIHLPYLGCHAVDTILSHVSLVNPPAEFAREVAELRARVADHSCQCPDCQPDIWSDSDRDEESDYNEDLYRD
jgi:hypothetical protein